MVTTNEIRSKFLSYYVSQGHTEVASSPLVPDNDPTLMFTNAGMVQFKNLFTGVETRDYTRAVTSQKCVRAGGKHNDLENVGHTARHHTFFEMLGNFSFGDYFKADAIEFAWNLITKEYGLPADKLLATVYHTDDEAVELWKKIAGFGDDKIIRIPTSDNFWSMGDTGPCGPCSEIFYDHGENIWGGPPGSPEEDGDRFIEIWNLVFMQFEKFADGSQTDLPKPSIDTGMGLERITTVLQGKHNNYDIDLMYALVEASANASGLDPDGDTQVSHRVIADHLRSAAFLVADGVLPSNEGRGYVLRRIMRRAMRHAHMIGNKDPMMFKLVPTLVAQMGEHFTELKQAESLITETLKLEETRFKQTLDRGLKLLNDETAKLGDKQALPGEAAFKLYDTYGFPLDLTADILRGENRDVDMDGFTEAMEAQKAAARKAWKGSGDTATENLWFDLAEKHEPTEFLGYAKTEASGEILALIKDGALVDSLATGESGFALLNQTPFYAESGGQQGDFGSIKTEDASVTVTDTMKKLGSHFAHAVTVDSGSLEVGAGADCTVDATRRNSLAQHHSATHLLHEALRRELGDHVAQRGSMVAGDRLRFDFSHTKPVGADELAVIERQVNEHVRQNTEVATRIMTPDEARALGAQALFGEKYGSEVRVVSMGAPEGPNNKPYSLELCGGTHVARTGDIGLVKLVTEEGLAAGTRRIEAVAGDAALAYFNQREALLTDMASTLKVAPADLPSRIEAMIADRKKLEQQLADTRKQLATGGGAAEVIEVAGIKFMGKALDGVPAKDLKGMADELKGQLGSGVVALVSNNEGKGSIVIGVTADLTDKLSAVDLVKAATAAMGGKGGGGRPDMAQAGGPEGEKAQEALDAVSAALAG